MAIPTFEQIPELVFNLSIEIGELKQLITSLAKESTPQENKKLTILQTAHMLGHKSRTYVYDLINAGKLKSLQLDGLTFVMELEAARYLELKMINRNNTRRGKLHCSKELINGP